MKLKPLQDWAVIRLQDAEERTAGGLYIPETAKEKPQQGIVEAIGPGALEEEKFGKKKDPKKERKFIATTVKPGDRVLFGKYAGQTYSVDGEELILVRERDILGILPEPLQIPSETSAEGSTALVKQEPKTGKTAARKSAATKKPAARPGKTAAKKTDKKK